jgi:hypothetical protein
VDFSGESYRIVAVNVNCNGDMKYDTDWIGPLDLRDAETQRLLDRWCVLTLELHGGYVHLFPADGDARQELEEYVAVLEEPT